DAAPAVSMRMAENAVEPEVSATFAMKSAPAEDAPQFTEVSQNVVPNEKLTRIARGAEREIANAEKILKKVEGRIDQETVQRITSEIAVAKAFFQDGVAYVASGDTSSAFEAYRQSVAVSAKLSVILKAFQKERLRLIRADVLQHASSGPRDSEVEDSNNSEREENSGKGSQEGQSLSED
ncbi:hypothetical protein K2X83_00450, partial [Patescibacteria group bacterium]|nr:hypothetical protein [Patescibacteria group bacterium]